MPALDNYVHQDYSFYNAQVGRQGHFSFRQPKPESDQTYGGIFVVPELPLSHEASWLWHKAKVEAVLASYAELENDWDGYGGQPAKLQSLVDALAFIDKLPNQAVPPRAMLSGNGEISLYWEDGSRYAEASFPGDGTYHFILDSDAKTLAMDDLNPSEEKVGMEVIEAIGSIYS